ncbi:MAG: hypothetical protein H7Z38_19045 [Rubrivivax sp.]|nr:hypothetical protein [Pyrinomonadaceae bacterium]
MIFLYYRINHSRFLSLILCVLTLAGGRVGFAQQQQPLTNEEFLAVVRQLPKQPSLKEQLISDLRRRGIGFALTSGLRSFVATKSGNDAELRRALEEAERRFVNPKIASTAVTSTEEADGVLGRARAATLEAVEQMPDFVVKQLITRSHAAGQTRNWATNDRLVVGVSYRESEGEKYRLLAVNGVVGAAQSDERSDYASTGGTSSTGEFVTELKNLFADYSKTEFKFTHEESLRGRRALVYDFEIKRANSRLTVGYGKLSAVLAGERGRVWIDREKTRVLRVERAATELPPSFPITASEQTIDYEWVTIQGQGEYLLPARSVLVMTASDRGRVEQSRNDIRFRNYQKFGTELKIIDDDIVEEEPPPPSQRSPEKKP